MFNAGRLVGKPAAAGEVVPDVQVEYHRGTHRKACPERDRQRSAEGATRPETLRQKNGNTWWALESGARHGRAPTEGERRRRGR